MMWQVLERLTKKIKYFGFIYKYIDQILLVINLFYIYILSIYIILKLVTKYIIAKV